VTARAPWRSKERGPRGAVGPPGPVGPSADEGLSELESRLDDLESGTSLTKLQFKVDEIDELRSDLDDLASGFDSLCAAISSAYISANSATEEMLFELDLACP
jgi:hypothetical protein